MAPAPLGPSWLLGYLHRTRQCGRTLDNLTKTCADGGVKRVLIDAKNLLYSFQFNWLALDVAAADRALRRFSDNFPGVELIFAFHDAGPKDIEFTGLRTHEQKIALGHKNMRLLRDLRSGRVFRNSDVPAPLFFSEWLISRVQELGFEAVKIEGYADHWHQLALAAKTWDCDFVVATSPDFLLFDMGSANYICAREPYGDGPTTFYHSAQVADALGLPLAGVHELSCLLGNHHITQAHLAEYHQNVSRLNGGLKHAGIVDALVRMERVRWSDGATYTLGESVDFVHETTGLSMKLIRQALEFYQTDTNPVVFPVAWPPSATADARRGFFEHIRFREGSWFGQTRLAAQFGDVIIRRDRVLQALRQYEYGLLTLSSRACDADNQKMGTEPALNVVEHRLEFCACDEVRQHLVLPKLPHFLFGAEGVDAQQRLSAKPLYEEFFNPESTEYQYRRQFYLRLFGANTAEMKSLPETLIPAACALRFLMSLDLPGLGMAQAVAAFITHLAVLQHGEKQRFVDDFNEHDDANLDEKAYGYFFVIYHALYEAVVNLNGLCGFPYPNVSRFDTLWDYEVFASIYRRGASLTAQEPKVEELLRRAVFCGEKHSVQVDLAPYGSIWVSPETHPFRRKPENSVPGMRQWHPVRDGSVIYQDFCADQGGDHDHPQRKQSFGVPPGFLHNTRNRPHNEQEQKEKRQEEQPENQQESQQAKQQTKHQEMAHEPKFADEVRDWQPKAAAGGRGPAILRRAPGKAQNAANQLLQRKQQHHNMQQNLLQKRVYGGVAGNRNGLANVKRKGTGNLNPIATREAKQGVPSFGKGKTLADHLDPRDFGATAKKDEEHVLQAPIRAAEVTAQAVHDSKAFVVSSLADVSMNWRGGGPKPKIGMAKIEEKPFTSKLKLDAPPFDRVYDNATAFLRHDRYCAPPAAPQRNQYQMGVKRMA